MELVPLIIKALVLTSSVFVILIVGAFLLSLRKKKSKKIAVNYSQEPIPVKINSVPDLSRTDQGLNQRTVFQTATIQKVKSYTDNQPVYEEFQQTSYHQPVKRQVSRPAPRISSKPRFAVVNEKMSEVNYFSKSYGNDDELGGNGPISWKGY